MWLLMFVFGLFTQIGFDKKIENTSCEICGEYKGGRFGFSWVTLNLSENREYDYYEGRHTMYSIKDKGNWVLRSDTLFLNSTKKTKWKYRHNKGSKKSYFFKNQVCRVQNKSILIEKENDASFNEAYYLLENKED